MPKIIDIPQNSPEWLEWRLGGIGGSDASLIAAYFLPDDCDWPYGNWAGAELYKLWSQKTGRTPQKEHQDKSFGDYIDPLVHGHKNEEFAREWYNATYGEFIEPVCLQHDILPHLRASLDGWVPGTAIVEIKCPKEKSAHMKVKEGDVPRQYWAQLHHNMCVAGTKLAHFVSWYKNDAVMIPVETDDKSLDKLREAEEIFWTWVVEKKFGGLPISGEVNNVDEEWAKLVRAYFINQGALRDLERRERQLKRELHLRMKATKVVGGGAKVSLSVRPAREVKTTYTIPEFLMMTIEEV